MGEQMPARSGEKDRISTADGFDGHHSTMVVYCQPQRQRGFLAGDQLRLGVRRLQVGWGGKKLRRAADGERDRKRWIGNGNSAGAPDHRGLRAFAEFHGEPIFNARRDLGWLDISGFEMTACGERLIGRGCGGGTEGNRTRMISVGGSKTAGGNAIFALRIAAMATI